MSNKRKLNKIISLKIYPFDVMVSFNESNEQFVESLGRYGKDTGDIEIIKLNDYSQKRGRTVVTPDNQTILRLNFYPKTNEDYGIIAHEIFHVVEFIMLRIGMKLCTKNDEAYAYLIQYLTVKILNLLK